MHISVHLFVLNSVQIKVVDWLSAYFCAQLCLCKFESDFNKFVVILDKHPVGVASDTSAPSADIFEQESIVKPTTQKSKLNVLSQHWVRSKGPFINYVA